MEATSKFSNATIESDNINIQYINIYPNSIVSIHHNIDRSICLELEQGRMEGEIIPLGGWRLTLDRTNLLSKVNWSGEINSKKSEPIIFDSKNMHLYMGVDYNDDGTTDMQLLNFHVSKLDFKDIEDNRDVSRIISAEIYLPDYDKDIIQLRRGDSLVIEMDRPIEIKQLSLTNPLKINIEGKVRTLVRNNRSLKPSILEWLLKHHQFVLYFLGFASFVSFVWANIKRLDLLNINRG
jgi:hypothetical protein